MVDSEVKSTVALAKDLSSVPNTYVEGRNHLFMPITGMPTSFSDFNGH